MFKTYFILLVFCHIMGHYYLQNENMAINKNKSNRMLMCHCLIYGGTVCLITGLIFWKIYMSIFVLAVLSHFIIDLAKSVLFRKCKEKITNRERDIYITDQILHLIFLGICAYVIRDCTVKGPVIELFNNLGIDKIVFMKICTFIMLMHKPANITIKRLIEGYKPLTDSVIEENKKTGAMIGTLERYVILIFLYLNQYSAIGLVLTAKSIARYKELENKEFAEYYLTGTLLSTLIVIAVYLFIVG